MTKWTWTPHRTTPATTLHCPAHPTYTECPVVAWTGGGGPMNGRTNGGCGSAGHGFHN